MRAWILGVLAALVAGVAVAAGPRQVVLAVDNMTCPACAITIGKALDRVPGVTARRIDAEAGTVTVTFDAGRTDVAAIARAVSEAGFPAHPKQEAGRD